jgi:mono/diheme cytochrome c family protein
MRIDMRIFGVAALALAICAPSFGADVAAGRAAAQAKCVQCHEADDWEGESAASLESLIRDIVAGKVKHKGKLDLTPEEIANIAAYWGTGGK